MNQAPTAKAEWGAHWPKVASGMIGMSFYAMLTYHFGLFIQPLQKEFGWSREAISWGLFIYTGGAFLLGPVIGLLIDRFGSRKIGIIGIIGTSLTLSALSFANGSLTQWYLLWLAIACTALGVKSTVWGAAISSLFTASRSLALSLVLSGSALAQFCAPLIANAVIADKGWRTAYQWLGLGWGGLALVLIVFFFFDAHDQKKKPESISAAPVSSLGGLTVRQALRSTIIWRIAIANLFMSLMGAGVSVHMVPILTGEGLDRTSAAGMAAAAGIAGLIGKLLTGALLDHIRGNLIPFLGFAFGAIGYWLLLNQLHSTAALTAGAMVLGFTSGAGLQITTYLCSRYAGMRNFGLIYACIASMLMGGTAVGPVIAGRVFDQTGSYHGLLLAAIPTVLICALMFIGLGPYPVFDEPETKT